MIIAIDGPSGAGKSTIARRVGEELGLFVLDTGAMYRSVALEVLRQKVDPDDAEAVAAVARQIQLHFDGHGQIFVDGACVAREIRANPLVRKAMVPKQKLVAERQGGVVAEGRDMTTVVFADTPFRFYLDASAEVRAKRRAEQRGTPEKIAEIRESLEARDRIDSGRSDSPLHLAEGVRHIDTDNQDVDAVVAEILGHVRSGVG
ncbi:UNVERIFIED_CONTAM: hypothetical protein GTU68_040255 [Idotea baltica]|nr:hypothetical protein [Idotea baltica]